MGEKFIVYDLFNDYISTLEKVNFYRRILHVWNLQSSDANSIILQQLNIYIYLSYTSEFFFYNFFLAHSSEILKILFFSYLQQLAN
jgi:hypothetical protein